MIAPPLYGLVLVGGKSRRMETDKAQLIYRDLPEATRCFELLAPVCEQVFYSVRPEQADEYSPSIIDHDLVGPLGGIAAAFKAHPAAAWLVLACDLPGFDQTTLDELLRGRVAGKKATVFKTDRLEPLCAVYEPSIAADIRQAMDERRFSPTRLLEQEEIHRVSPRIPRNLANLNTPEQAKKWRDNKSSGSS